METKEKLNKLFKMQFESEQINETFDGLKKQIPVPEIPPEIQAKLDEIEVQRATALETLQKDIENLTAEIKQDVLAFGATIKGDYMMAVWNKGRDSWNGKLLEGFAIAHPEILSAKSTGDPSVTIRKNAIK